MKVRAHLEGDFAAYSRFFEVGWRRGEVWCGVLWRGVVWSSPYWVRNKIDPLIIPPAHPYHKY